MAYKTQPHLPLPAMLLSFPNAPVLDCVLHPIPGISTDALLQLLTSTQPVP